jgi:hypothetical protein
VGDLSASVEQGLAMKYRRAMQELLLVKRTRIPNDTDTFPLTSKAWEVELDSDTQVQSTLQLGVC